MFNLYKEKAAVVKIDEEPEEEIMSKELRQGRNSLMYLQLVL